MTIRGIRIPMMASLLIWALLWEVVGRAEVTILIPPLSATLVRLVEIAGTETFWDALAITARTFALGSAVAILVGVPVGILMGRLPLVDRMLLPWVNTFISAPLSALVPVIMAIFGFGETTIVLTVVLFAIWIVILDARAGTEAISPSLVEMARVYGATRWQAFSKIYVQSALPEILTGIRLGLLRAVKGVIIGQLLVSVVGFGHLFEIYSSNFLMEHMWALLVVLFGLAFALDAVLGAVERRVDHFASSRQ
ncbi:ABC transporter permease [Prosthecomicrobium sp. N25]|uniref:ABC transporter permease n=1 Tax=Prosthecomicrobium sp. N25 TaxID=3129254 RepID=UPI0030788876